MNLLQQDVSDTAAHTGLKRKREHHFQWSLKLTAQLRRLFTPDTENFSCISTSFMTYLPISRQSACLVVYSSSSHIFILSTLKPIILALTYEQ